MNGSSVQILNNSNDHKLALGNNLEKNNNFLTPNVSEKDPKDLSQEESLESFMKISTNIIPRGSNIYVYFILVGILLYL